MLDSLKLIAKKIGGIFSSIFGSRKNKTLNPASTELTRDEEQGMIEGTNIPKSIIDKTIEKFYKSKSKVLDASGVSQEESKRINQLLDSVSKELPTPEARGIFSEARKLAITGLEPEMNNPLAYIPEEYKPEVDILERTQKDKLDSDILERDKSHRLYVINAVLGSEAIEDQSFSSLKKRYIDAFIDLEGENVYRYFGIDRTEPHADSVIIHNIFNTSAMARRQYISEIMGYSQQQQQQQQPRHNFVKKWYSTEKSPDKIDPEAKNIAGNDMSSRTTIYENLGDDRVQ